WAAPPPGGFSRCWATPASSGPSSTSVCARRPQAAASPPPSAPRVADETLEPALGIEPRTYALRKRRSTTELCRPKVYALNTAAASTPRGQRGGSITEPIAELIDGFHRY